MDTPNVIGQDEAAVTRRIEAHAAMFPGLRLPLDEWRARGFIGGSPAEVINQLKAREAAGVSRFMLQHNDLDDMASLEMLAAHVLPHMIP